MSTDLTNKTILVTGAGNGIGQAVSIELAKHGANVILLGKTAEHLETTYDEITACSNSKPAIYPLNLEMATQEDYSRLTETLKSEYGQLDGLIHNAATLGVLTSIEHYDALLWHKVLQVNLNAVFLLTQFLLPLLKKSKNASIVFTEDPENRHKPLWGAYGVSKSALNGFIDILAGELEASSIRVNAIELERVRTSLRAHAYPAEIPSDNTPPSAVTEPFVFLMSDESIGVHGQRHKP